MDQSRYLIRGVGAHIDQNIDMREYMEDVVNTENVFNKGEPSKTQRFYMVCDGHAGKIIADRVSENLPNIFMDYINGKCSETKTTEERLVKSFSEVDDNCRNEGEEVYKEAGCTTNCIYITYEKEKKYVYSANVGDSRTVLIRKDKALRLSYDHKASDPKEKERVVEDGGMIRSKRFYGVLSVTRAHGDFHLKDEYEGLSIEPHITKTEIKPDDMYIVMASDGLYDVFTDDQLYDTLSKKVLDENNPEFLNQLSKELVDSAIKLGTKDNTSVIIVRLN